LTHGGFGSGYVRPAFSVPVLFFFYFCRSGQSQLGFGRPDGTAPARNSAVVNSFEPANAAAGQQAALILANTTAMLILLMMMTLASAAATTPLGDVLVNASCVDARAGACQGWCFDGVNTSYYSTCMVSTSHGGTCKECDPIALLVAPVPIILHNTSCGAIGYKVPILDPDPFFGRHSKINSWASSIGALLDGGIRSLKDPAARKALLNLYTQWREDNPQCAMT
jgi:hypothetical protein